MAELGLEPLILGVLRAHQLVIFEGFKLLGEKADRKGTGDQALVSLFYHTYLYHIYISTSLYSFPWPLVELSPGGPALFSEAAAHLKKLELETVKAAGPWPALHININKVQRTRGG